MANVNSHDDIRVLPEGVHGLAAGLLDSGNGPEIGFYFLRVPLHETGCAKGPAIHEDDPGVADFGLDFRTVERGDFLRRALAQGEDSFAENRMTLIQQASRARRMKKDPRAANGAAHAGNDVQPASSRCRRILAVNVSPHCLEKSGVGMKRGIDHAMSLLLRQGDEIGEEDDAIPHAPASARDDKEFA